LAHNPEIDWEKDEVRMTKCPLMYRRNKKVDREETRKMAVS